MGDTGKYAKGNRVYFATKLRTYKLRLEHQLSPLSLPVPGLAQAAGIILTGVVLGCNNVHYTKNSFNIECYSKYKIIIIVINPMAPGGLGLPHCEVYRSWLNDSLGERSARHKQNIYESELV
jgi:hypothetical protein